MKNYRNNFNSNTCYANNIKVEKIKKNKQTNK